jgi:hypothetical protein
MNDSEAPRVHVRTRPDVALTFDDEHNSWRRKVKGVDSD